jgi:hypothetical protein
MMIKIDSLCIGIWKIYVPKQFREIIYMKFCEIPWNYAKFREILQKKSTKFRGILQN